MLTIMNMTTIIANTTEGTNLTNLSDTTDDDFDSQILNASEYQASVLIWKYIPPVLLLLGGFGNVATIFVLRRISWGQSTQHVFLTALAVVDLGLLYTGLLRQWMWYTFQIDLRDLRVVLCKLYTWLVYSLGNASAWLLTAVTVQRAMSTIWPHRINSLCTHKVSSLAMVLVVLTSFALHMQKIFIMKIDEDGYCAPDEDMHDFDVVWTWVDLLSSSLIPALILLVCNLFLAATLFRAARESSSMLRSTRGKENSASRSEAGSRKRTARSLTIMLMVLSVTFLLLTLPVCVYLLWERYWEENILHDAKAIAKTRLTWAIVSMLWYANSAVNFLLYCISGTKFRAEFLAWITCGRVKDTQGQGHSKDSRGHSSVYATSVSAGQTSESHIVLSKF